jgi:hypothetical protein
MSDIRSFFRPAKGSTTPKVSDTLASVSGFGAQSGVGSTSGVKYKEEKSCGSGVRYVASSLLDFVGKNF